MANKVKSPQKFCFGSRDEDAIVRVAAYHRKDFDLAVIRYQSIELERMRKSVSQTSTATLSRNLSSFGCLPVEILRPICLSLDVRSLLRFAQVNRRTRDVAHSLYEFKAISTHALDALCALLRTRVASYFTILDLFTTLCTKQCSICQAFSAFVFLPTCSRVCFSCVTFSPATRMVSVASLTSSNKLRRRSIQALYTVPGIYSMKQTLRQRRIHLMTEQEAKLKYPHHCTSSSDNSTILPFMAATSLPYLDRNTNTVERGLSCKGCQVTVEERFGSMSTSTAARNAVYSVEGYLSHFRRCVAAQRLWQASERGTVAFEEPAMTKNGGFFEVEEIVMAYPTAEALAEAI